MQKCVKAAVVKVQVGVSNTVCVYMAGIMRRRNAGRCMLQAMYATAGSCPVLQW